MNRGTKCWIVRSIENKTVWCVFLYVSELRLARIIWREFIGAKILKVTFASMRYFWGERNFLLKLFDLRPPKFFPLVALILTGPRDFTREDRYFFPFSLSSSRRINFTKISSRSQTKLITNIYFSYDQSENWDKKKLNYEKEIEIKEVKWVYGRSSL